MITTKIIYSLTLGCSLAILSACNSSSNDDNPADDNTATVPADAIALTAANALEKIWTSSASIDHAFAALNTTNEALLPSKPTYSAGTRHLSDFARTLVNKYKTNNTAPTGVSINDTVPCDSGTLKYNVAITSTATTESTNGSVTFNNCVYNTASINGIFKFTITDDYSNEYLKNSGTNSSSSLIFVIDGISHTFKNFNDSWSDDDSTGIYTQSSSFSYSSSAINGGILVQDTTPHQQYSYDLHPFTGVTLATGANNSKIRITYLNETQFKLEVDEDGDGTFEFTQTIAWINVTSPSIDTPAITSPTLPSDAIVITQASADALAQTAKTTINDALLSFINHNGLYAKTSTSSATHLLHFSDFARNISYNNKSASINRSNTTTSETIFCDTGYATVNADYYESQTSVNELQTSTTGSLIFSDCAFFPVIVNGTFNFTDEITYTESETATTSTGHGLDYSSNMTITVYDEAHQFTDYHNTWSYDDTTSLNTSSAAFSYSSALIGGGIMIEDTSTIQHYYTDLYPFAGTTLITGAENTKLLLTHLNAQEYSVEVDADGDDTFESNTSYFWPEFIK